MGRGHISGGKDYRGLKKEIKAEEQNFLKDEEKMGGWLDLS